MKLHTPERLQWSCSGVFIATFEEMSQIVLVFPLLTLNEFRLSRYVSTSIIYEEY